MTILSDCVNALADLNLRGAHMSDNTLSDISALICIVELRLFVLILFFFSHFLYLKHCRPKVLGFFFDIVQNVFHGLNCGHHVYCYPYHIKMRSGGAKVSCLLRPQGVRLILAYSWGSPAILVAGKDRGEMFLFLLFFFHFLSCSSFFPVTLFYYVFSLFSPFL